MDFSTHKRYHVHGFDSRQFLEHYFSDKSEMVFGDDTLKFVIENLRQVFSGGHINGDILIDLSSGSIIHHLYSACEFFKNIIVLKVNNRCIMELKRWVDERTGAFYWGHTSKLLQEKEENSDQFQDQEAKLRSALQHVVKCDLEKENMTDPLVLPLADCIISTWLLGVISKDQDDYIRYLRKFSRLLKPGGHIISIGTLGTTYYTVGKDKFHVFTFDEDFLRKSLIGEGFIIDYCNVKDRMAVSDITDYKAVIFIAAHKEK
ncbi:indolethylamine N-methyltransferase-like [Rhinoderma darwinii]|uniref:indolethylamine N-methyltransferase-like n=1 Tax=Rhinoderma darwinii TaxID=43563 RepID=UPI003F6718EF